MSIEEQKIRDLFPKLDLDFLGNMTYNEGIIYNKDEQVMIVFTMTNEKGNLFLFSEINRNESETAWLITDIENSDLNIIKKIPSEEFPTFMDFYYSKTLDRCYILTEYSDLSKEITYFVQTDNNIS